MRKGRLKYGVYEESFRPECKKCKKKFPECKHMEPPKRIVFLGGPDQIWMQLNGTNYPAVRYRTFNDFNVVEMVLTETQFRDRFIWVGRHTSVVNRVDKLETKR